MTAFVSFYHDTPLADLTNASDFVIDYDYDLENSDVAYTDLYVNVTFAEIYSIAAELAATDIELAFVAIRPAAPDELDVLTPFNR